MIRLTHRGKKVVLGERHAVFSCDNTDDDGDFLASEGFMERRGAHGSSFRRIQEAEGTNECIGAPPAKRARGRDLYMRGEPLCALARIGV